MTDCHISHLKQLEAESIHIIREVAAEFQNPVMLYSTGKDSSVMLRLAQKAFYPAKIPFPLMHIDTNWKFREMIAFREKTAREAGFELKVYINPDGIRDGINPFDHGSELHTRIMKTEALKKALDLYGFDAAFGGARRDEERSRAKERVFSFRDRYHQWDPKNQRPELWNLYNCKIRRGESIRIFPLSDWTELDIWHYIKIENIPVVSLYFAQERPVVARNGRFILADDDRLKLEPGEKVVTRKVRFRTLGCYPLTEAVESDAETIEEVLRETFLATSSERQGRVIDYDGAGSMEEKKKDGYF
ncbi:MAG: sulfate adenylyltransferase subunit CysD [Victivallaceae bacterium]|nr:sulfate adenylyltransferase subunit CysD [Victivallaceae bacterium]